MKLFKRQPTPTEQLKDAAIEAVIRALDDQKDEPKTKSRLPGGRALAVGAVLYVAGLAAYKNRDLLREQLSPSRSEDDEATQAHEDEREYEQEPGAAEDEDFEPEAVEEDEPEVSRGRGGRGRRGR